MVFARVICCDYILPVDEQTFKKVFILRLKFPGSHISDHLILLFYIIIIQVHDHLDQEIISERFIFIFFHLFIIIWFYIIIISRQFIIIIFLEFIILIKCPYAIKKIHLLSFKRTDNLHLINCNFIPVNNCLSNFLFF